MQLIQFLTNRGTQLVVLGVDNSGRNWYTWSRHLGTQLIYFLDRGTQLVLPPILLSFCNKTHSDMQHHTSVTPTVWRQMVRLLASNKLKACERKRSWNNLWYYPGTAARKRSRYMDNLRAGRPEVRIPERSTPPPPQSLKNRHNRLWNLHSLPFNGYRDSFTGAKRMWHEDDHSSVSSAEVKNKWTCASAPTTYLHDVERANFTFAYTILSLAWTNWQETTKI
jgi:hypothetical protein